MVDRSQKDSSRELLEELEEGWMATPRAPSVSDVAADAAPPSTAEANAPVEDDDASEPDAAKVDEGWLDDLFPGEDGEDDAEDEEDEGELPDERLDPVAFAAAKAAREERARERKERKKARAEAKRARQKARAEAIKGRQKQKSKKARTGGPASARQPAARPIPKDRPAALAPVRAVEEPRGAALVPAAPTAPARRTAAEPVVKKPDTKASLRLLAIVLVVLLAAAALIAALIR